MKEPCFLLGIGCQKGATTWLHSYLSRHPNVDMGFTKEYHILDALYVPECRKFFRLPFENLGFALKSRNMNMFRSNLKLALFLLNPSSYFRYFERLYSRSDTTVSLVGDITPSYCALPKAALSMVRSSLISKGFRPKIVFIMRDPVERCWSAVRMNRRNLLQRNSDYDFRHTTEARLLNVYRDRRFDIRTRYDLTVENVEAAFDKEEVFLTFYEDLFDRERVSRLTEFLEIPYLEPDFASKQNSSTKTEDIAEDTKREIALHYKDVYTWAFRRFGENYIRSIWPSAAFID